MRKGTGHHYLMLRDNVPTKYHWERLPYQYEPTHHGFHTDGDVTCDSAPCRAVSGYLLCHIGMVRWDGGERSMWAQTSGEQMQQLNKNTKVINIEQLRKSIDNTIINHEQILTKCAAVHEEKPRSETVVCVVEAGVCGLQPGSPLELGLAGRFWCGADPLNHLRGLFPVPFAHTWIVNVGTCH